MNSASRSRAADRFDGIRLNLARLRLPHFASPMSHGSSEVRPVRRPASGGLAYRQARPEVGRAIARFWPKIRRYGDAVIVGRNGRRSPRPGPAAGWAKTQATFDPRPIRLAHFSDRSFARKTRASVGATSLKHRRPAQEHLAAGRNGRVGRVAPRFTPATHPRSFATTRSIRRSILSARLTADPLHGQTIRP
jgi:hypothetical protein